MLISDPFAVARGRWATDSQAWATPGKGEELTLLNLMNREWGGKSPAQNQSVVIVTRRAQEDTGEHAACPTSACRGGSRGRSSSPKAVLGPQQSRIHTQVSSLTATLVQGWASEEDPRQWRSGSLWAGLKVWGCDSGWSSKRGRGLGRRQCLDHPGGASSGWRWRQVA